MGFAPSSGPCVLGVIWERHLCPEHPAQSGGGTIKRASVLKTFWVLISFPAPSPCLCVCLLLPCPISQPVLHGLAPLCPSRSASGNLHRALGRAFWISWRGGAGKVCPHFPLSLPCFSCSPELCLALLSGPSPSALAEGRAGGPKQLPHPPRGRFVPVCCLLLFPVVSVRLF